MSITFAHPAWLLLLLLVVPVGWTAWRWFQAMTRLRMITTIAARSLLIALIACMLAGAATVRVTDRVAAIAVVDVSESVTQFADFGTDPERGRISANDAITRWLDEATSDRRPDDLFGLVVFDGRALAVATPTRREGVGIEYDYHMTSGTDIEGALRFAESLFPPDAARRLLLVSDGNETAGNAIDAAREIAAGSVESTGAHTPIDVLPIAYELRNEVMVASIDAPPTASGESAVTVRVVLQSTDEASGSLELLYNGTPLDLNGSAAGTGRPVQLAAGRTVVTVPDVQLSDDPVHRIEAVFVPAQESDDRLTSNNRAETFTVTPGRGKVLVVDGVSDGQPGPGAILGETLSAADIETVTLGVAELPLDLLSYQAYDLVIFQNVPADRVPEAVQETIVDYVSDLGGGFMMVGGPESFGAGGWKGTPIEPILPVKLDLPEQLITPPAAIVIVLDNSGSMGDPVLGGARSQQEVANEGAALAVGMLDQKDLICVITFNSTYDIRVPMGPNADPERTADRVRSISPGGGTNMYPALRRAYEELKKVDATVKHVLVLSDGQSEGDAEVGVATAAAMKADGITVSTISVGDSADYTTLHRIATAGGGEPYRVYNPNVLPRYFIRDIRVVRQPLIRRQPFQPEVSDPSSPLLLGMPTSIPLLQGLVLTQARDDARISYAMRTPKDEPLLAHWFVGRGQVGAFTSDASEWASAWLTWPGYAAMWTQTARQLARPAGAQGYELVTEMVDDELVIRLDAVDEEGTPLELLTVEGAVHLPEGDEVSVRLTQTGPGTYRARVPATQRGNYIVTLLPRQGQKRLPPVFGGASRLLGPEFRRTRSNVGVLRDIAEATGGRVQSLDRPAQAALFTREGTAPVRAEMPMWPTLLTWTVVIFILDVGTRRVAWDRLLTREVALAVQEQTTEALRRRSEQATATLGSLRERAARTPEHL
ncbi:MAG: VWA domain-containing protein, partial [Phycisphaerales bacterium]|nr:VWA domain-containing protein [Phycisphaerales bacterium]